MKKVLNVIFAGAIIALFACNSSIPPTNRIVIGSNREIYAIDEKGSELPVSPPFSYYDVNASGSKVQWSPNHEWVVYQTEDTASPNDPQIFIAKADGTKKFELTNNDQNSGNNQRSGENPVWSPDGNQIAAHFWNGFWDSNGQDGIYIVDVSCLIKEQNCIFNYRYLVKGTNPSWSFNGKQIAFLSYDNQVSVVSIGNPRNVKTISPDGVECLTSGLAWSPVNTEIAVTCRDSSPGVGIFLVNSDGSNFRRITFGKNGDISPVWSPDGTKIAFISYRNNTVIISDPYEMSPSAVFIMNRDGSGVKQISPHSNEEIYWITWVSP